MTTTLKTTELAEAVATFATSEFDPQAMRPLMDLIEGQTDYIQKRFWKLVDERKAEIRFQRNAWKEVRDEYEASINRLGLS